MIRFCKVTGRYAITDTETKEKLTELQHQIEMLRTDMEANMKTMRAENDSALSMNEAAIERLRTGIALSRNEAAIERLRTGIFIQMVGVVAAGVAVLGGFIAILQFLR